MKEKSSATNKNTIRNYNFKFILVAILYHTFAQNLYGQGQFTPGYIVTLQNDTIRGQIKYKDWIESPKEVELKSADNSKKIFQAADVKAFGINSERSIYHSRKIGVLDISLTARYSAVPSLIAKDSAQVFLKVLVFEKHASLYLYLDTLERPHYFLESNGILTELFNYSYYRIIGNKSYLLQIDHYKKQLHDLAEKSPHFTDSLPLYQEKFMKRYIANYIGSFPDAGKPYLAQKQRFLLDLDVSFGLESWSEIPVVLNNKPTFGIGARVSFPGKFYNRFCKINVFLTPDALLGYDPILTKRVTLQTYELAVGSYIGNSRLRPYFGVHHSGVAGSYRSNFLGLQSGLSLDRRFNLEFGHFANFASAITETTFLTRPRISFHCMLPLNFNTLNN